MNNSFKTISLLITVATVTPLRTIDTHNTVQSYNLLNTANGESTRVSISTTAAETINIVVDTIGGEISHIPKDNAADSAHVPIRKTFAKEDIVSNNLVRPIDDDFGHIKPPFIYTLNKAFVYSRGIVLTGGTITSLYLIAQRMDFSHASDCIAYWFTFCMGMAVVGDGLYNLLGHRVSGYTTEMV
jgi:hypothetical protein